MCNGTAGSIADGAELPRTLIDLPCSVRLKSCVVGTLVGTGALRMIIKVLPMTRLNGLLVLEVLLIRRLMI